MSPCSWAQVGLHLCQEKEKEVSPAGESEREGEYSSIGPVTESLLLQSLIDK